MTAPLPPQVPDARPVPTIPTGIRVASTLCWIVGVLTLFAALAVQFREIRPGGTTFLQAALTLVLGVAVCAAGFLIRRQRRLGVLLLVLAWATPPLWALAHQLPPQGNFLTLAALAFSGLNWKHLS